MRKCALSLFEPKILWLRGGEDVSSQSSADSLAEKRDRLKERGTSNIDIFQIMVILSYGRTGRISYHTHAENMNTKILRN